MNTSGPSGPSRPVRSRVWIFAAAVLLLAVAIGVRVWGRAGDGLVGRYYANQAWIEPAAHVNLDTAVSTELIGRRWDERPPSEFSVRWTGTLSVLTTDTYTFELESDDGSRLFIDDRIVVDNGGAHASVAKQGQVRLDAGPHAVTLDFRQLGADYELEWRWARGAAGTLESIPTGALSRRRVGLSTAFAARAADALLWPIAALAVLALVWARRELGVERRAVALSHRHPAWLCLALFAGLTVIETWPLATNPARLSRNDNGDTVLNEWILAWVAHQAPNDLLHLYDANIFYPATGTLALSETMFVQSAIAAPLLWAGASPVLAYNVVLLLGFCLTGWAMAIVVARWTGDWTAGIVAGVIVGFCSHTLMRMPHLQAQHVEFLPLALLALDEVLRAPRIGAALRLAVWFALQSVTSYYLAVASALALTAAFLARPESWLDRRHRDRLVYLVIAGVVAVLLLSPYLWPYWRAFHGQGMTRRVDVLLNATWADYLTTPARLDRVILQGWSSGTGLFPGFIALALAALAIATGALRDARARMCLAMGVVGVALSFGTSLPGYATLFSLLTPLQGIRAPSRFGYLSIIAVGVLAGFGVAALRDRSRRPWQLMAVSVVLPVLVVVESLAAPIGYRWTPDNPAIYTDPALGADAVVLELPFPDVPGLGRNAHYMLGSTSSWYRLVNGYSGFVPESYFAQYAELRDFPNGPSIGAMRRYGVTHLIVHGDVPEPNRDAIDRIAGFRRLRTEGDAVLYDVRATTALVGQ